ANALRHASLAAPDGSLQALFAQVANRIILQSANAGRRETLTFPREIIGDTAPPQISNVVVTRVGASIRVTWNTNEFANSTVLYGTQTGSYPQSVTNPLFERQHEINLTGLRGGTTYFLRVRSADLSGNTATGAERSIVAGGGVYLPYVARRR
ncbi:MAG: fibronectin type III domain-containing protein, partial [Anaerolineae bacterium]